MKTKKYKSLKTRMVLVIGAIVTVLLFTFFIISLMLTKRNLRATLSDNYQARTDYFSENATVKVVQAAGLLDAEIGAVASINLTSGTASATRVLEEMTASNDTVMMAYVGLDDAKLYNGSKWTPPDGWDCRTRGWYTDAVAAGGDVIYSDPYVDDNTGDLVVTISKYFESGKYKGVAAVDLSLNALFGDLTERVSASGNSDDYAFVISGAGDLLYHPNEEFKSTVEKIITVSDVLDGAYATALETGAAITDYTGTEVYLTSATSDISGWTIVYVSPSYHYDTAIKSVQDQLFIIFVFFALVCDISIFIVGRSITRKMIKSSKELNVIITSINEGHADLTRTITVKDNTEIGQMIDGINMLLNTLEGVVSKITEAADSLAIDVDALRESANISSDNVNNISATMEEMSAGTEETAASTSLMAQQIGGITTLTGEVSANVSNKAKEVEKDRDKVSETIADIKARDKAMADRLSKAIAKMNEKISATKKVEEIRMMTEGISDVADQTNLLSLNASIEAARAGEAGRGFAVVAGEIGSLANNSAEMAQKIQSISDEVLQIVDELVGAAENVSSVMLEINEQNSREKDNILEEYNKSLEGTLETIKSVADSTEEISKAVNNIQDSISAIDVTVSENAEGINQVASGTTELVSVSDEVISRAASVGDITETLKKEVGKFKI